MTLLLPFHATQACESARPRRWYSALISLTAKTCSGPPPGSEDIHPAVTSSGHVTCGSYVTYICRDVTREPDVNRTVQCGPDGRFIGVVPYCVSISNAINNTESSSSSSSSNSAAAAGFSSGTDGSQGMLHCFWLPVKVSFPDIWKQKWARKNLKSTRLDRNSNKDIESIHFAALENGADEFEVHANLAPIWTRPLWCESLQMNVRPAEMNVIIPQMRPHCVCLPQLCQSLKMHDHHLTWWCVPRASGLGSGSKSSRLSPNQCGIDIYLLFCFQSTKHFIWTLS